MKDFYYWEPEMQFNGEIRLEKYLIAKDDNDIAIGKYNLSKMGLTHINTYEELKRLLPLEYKFSSGTLINDLI